MWACHRYIIFELNPIVNLSALMVAYQHTNEELRTKSLKQFHGANLEQGKEGIKLGTGRKILCI